MKLMINRFPDDGFDPGAEGYRHMKEPDMRTLIWISIPVGLSAAAGLFFLAQALTQTTLTWAPPDLQVGILAKIGIWLAVFLLFNVVMILLHELLHALMFPEPLTSDRICFGMLSAGAFFAYYTGEIKRSALIRVLLAPFCMLSVIPWLVIVILDINMPLVMMALAYHTLCAAGDLIGVFLILADTPRHSVLRNRGYKTYYKIKDGQ